MKKAIVVGIIIIGLIGLGCLLGILFQPGNSVAGESSAASAETSVQGAHSSSTEHIHTYESEVTEPTCVEGGYTTFTCSVCGDTIVKDYTEAIPHDWEDWFVTIEPSADEEGEQVRTCRACGATERETIDRLPEDHEHDYEEETVAPTCTEQGYTKYTCSCGDSYTAGFVEARGHDFKTSVVEPTCTGKGSRTKTCEVCGHTETESTDALGHDYKTSVTEPTCTEAGSETKTCKRCGHTETESVPAVGHAWSGWSTTVEPTTESVGEKQRTCSHCGEVEVEEIPLVEENGEDDYESYIDPRITAEQWPRYMRYTYDEYGLISIVDRRTWGEPPSIWVNEDGSLTVVFINQDGERIESIVEPPPEGYCRTWTIRDDGTIYTYIIGDLG